VKSYPHMLEAKRNLLPLLTTSSLHRGAVLQPSRVMSLWYCSPGRGSMGGEPGVGLTDECVTCLFSVRF